MTQTPPKSARVQLLLIAILFFGPLAVAAIMYYGGLMQPEGRTNHGELLTPVINVADRLPDRPAIVQIERSWALIYVDNQECLAPCKQALYTIRQSRLMLGKESDRLSRVFLHADTAPDTVFLADEHAGLISLQDDDFSALLDNAKPATLPTGGYFLMDPLGNLVMYFEPGIDPGEMVEDIQRLLKFSRIG